MNFYGLEILDEISFFVLTVFFGIIIVIAWMSTKVDCDFRHVRTIILEANDQRIHNYTNNVNQTNTISMEDMLSSDFDGNTLDNAEMSYGEFDQSETIDGDNQDIGDVSPVSVIDDLNKEPSNNLPSTSNYQRISEIKSRGSHPNSLSRNIIRMKIKYLDDREKWVFTDVKQTILAFKRDNFSEELTRDLNVRLIYNGQELKENDRILEQYGLANNCTVHCLVTQSRSNLPLTPTQDSSSSLIGSDRSDIEIGSLMFPLFGALLTVIWYCRICYRHYFNVITTFALIGMTIIYLIACITCLNFGSSSYPVNNHHRQHATRVRPSPNASVTSSSQTAGITFTSTFSSF